MSSRVACSRGDRLSALIGRAPLTLDAQRPHPGGRVHAKNPSRRYACDVCRVCPQRPRTSHGPARRARETANDLEF